MSKDISIKIREAFLNDKPLSLSNTKVKVENGITRMYLFGNLIAQKTVGKNDVIISNAGWATATTRDRLNAIGASISIKGSKKKVQNSGDFYNNGKLMEKAKWYKLDGSKTSKAKEAISMEMSYEMGGRGYGYIARPTFAVAGANNTGNSDDSLCPTDVCEKELAGFKKILSDNGIAYMETVCESDNVFMVRHFIVVSEKDHPKAYELAKEYAKGDTRLFYAEAILRNEKKEAI